MNSPIIWGPYFWSFMLHPAGQVVPEQLNEEESKELEYWALNTCDYLLCGACSGNCRYHATQHPPTFKTRQDVWHYFYQKHNSVNERKFKIQPTETEALLLLQQTYQMKGVEWSQLTHTWLFEYWFILKLTTLVMLFDPVTQTSQVNAERLEKWWKWVRSTCYAWPFAYHMPSTRAKLLAFVDGMDLKQITSASDVDQMLIDWQNDFADDFQVEPLTVSSFQREFNRLLESKQMPMLIWANQRLEEANRKMVSLQQEMNKANRVDPVTGQDWQTIAYIMIALSCVLFVMLVAVFLYYRFYLACGQSPSKSSSSKSNPTISHRKSIYAT